MELFDLACAVDEAVRIIPSVVRVMAFPFSLVLKHTVSDSAGDNVGHGIFRLSINFGWWWWRFNLTRQWVHCCFAKSVSAKYVTQRQVLREVQDVGMAAHRKDLERAGALVIELRTGPVRRSSFERYIDDVPVSNVGFGAVLVCLLALTLLDL